MLVLPKSWELAGGANVAWVLVRGEEVHAMRESVKERSASSPPAPSLISYLFQPVRLAGALTVVYFMLLRSLASESRPSAKSSQ